jgi:hypothetical protein
MSQLLLAKQLGMLANPKLSNMNGWQDRHNAAVSMPKAGLERAVVTMLTGWLEYAYAHQETYESPIGQDYVLGPEWQRIGDAIHGLLDGDCGRLDCGTLSALIYEAMRGQGCEVEQ